MKDPVFLDAERARYEGKYRKTNTAMEFKRNQL